MNSDDRARNEITEITAKSSDIKHPEKNYSRQIKTMREAQLLSEADLDKAQIIHAGMANRDIINLFRDLRTKVLHTGQRENFVILVSCVCEQGGGSFVARNLAAAFAFDQSKTALLIDCNLYEPSVHTTFGIEAELGLTDYLADESIDVDEIIYASGVPRLRVIPTGNYCESGNEHFTSDRMKKLIDDLLRRYPDRYIVIDAPAVSASADTRILVELCDQALLVVPYGKVVESDIRTAIESLSRTKFAGVVFNN